MVKNVKQRAYQFVVFYEEEKKLILNFFFFFNLVRDLNYSDHR